MVLARSCLKIALAIGLFGAFPVAASEPEKRSVDLYGDPLPAGAVARLGTVRLRQPNSGSISIAFSQDGKMLATGGNNTIQVWSTSEGRLLHQIRENYEDGEIVFSSNGKWLATPTEQAICLLDTTTGKLIRRIPSVGVVFAVSPDGKQMALAGGDGSMSVKSTDDSKEVHRWSESKRPAILVSFTSDGKFLLAITRENKLYRWDLAKGKLDKTIELKFSGWQNLIVSPDGKLLAIAPTNGASAEIWDVETGSKKYALSGDGISGRLALAFSPDGKKLASDWRDAKKEESGIAVWDTSDGKILQRIPAAFGELTNRRFPLAVAEPIFLRFAPDNNTLAAFLGSSSVRLWDTSTGKSVLDFPGHNQPIKSLSFTANDRNLVSAAEDIRQWESTTGRQVRELLGHRGGFNIASVRPNGRQILSGGADGTILLHDLDKAQEIRRFTVKPGSVKGGRDYWVYRLAVSPDGKNAASFSLVPGSRKALIQVWDLNKEKPLVTREDTSAAGEFPQFSPDGLLLAKYSGVQPRPRTMPAQLVPPVQPALPGLAGEVGGLEVVIQEVATGKTLLRLPQPDASYYATAFTLDNQILATTTYEQSRGPSTPRPGPALESSPGPSKIHIWELLSGKEQQTIPLSKGGDSRITQMAFSPNQRVLATAGQGGGNAGGAGPIIQLWDVISGKEILSRKGFESEVSPLVFSDDGRFLASGHTDGTVLVWDIGSVNQSQPSDKAKLQQIESWWTDLADEDARKAEAAVWGLVGAGQSAVEFLRQRVRAAAGLRADQIQHLIAELNSNDFGRREEATKQLAALEELAQPALKEALKGKPSAEQRRRIEKLLEPLFFVVTDPEKRRQLRAIRVLERIGSPLARKAIAELAQGAPETKMTIAAKNALQRLERRMLPSRGLSPPEP